MASVEAPRVDSGSGPTAPPSLIQRLDAERFRRLAESAVEQLRQPEMIALQAILLFALAIRLVWLGTLPPDVTADEADNLRSVYQILAGTGPGLFGLDWAGMPALNTYVIAASMSTFDYTIAAMRLPSVLISTAALVPFFLLARRAAGSIAALLTTLLLATSTWFLYVSRSGWEGVWVSLFALAAMLFLERGLERGRLADFALAGIFCALGLYGYFVGRLVLLALLLTLPLALSRGTLPAKRVIVGYAIMTLVAIVVFAPQLPTWLREREAIGARPESVTIFENSASTADAARALLQRSASTVRALILIDPSVPYNARFTRQESALVDPITAVALVAGLAFGLLWPRSVGTWWVLFLVGVLIPEVIARGPVDAGRLAGFAPVLYLFVAFAIGEVLRRPSLVPIRLALIALVPLAVHMNLSEYVDWMESPELAEARQPSVAAADFPTWQSAQLAEIRAGGTGFNLAEWEERRPLVAKRLASGPPRIVEVSEIPAGEGSSAPRVGRVVTVVGSSARDQQLNDPHGIAVDAEGNVYVADSGGAQVQKFSAAGELVALWGTRGEDAGSFQEPFDLVVGAEGTVFVLDSVRGVVLRFSSIGAYEATLLEDADTYRPRGIARDEDGLLYIADTGRNRILQFSPDGEILQTWESEPGREIEQPTDVAVDAEGNVYLAEPDAERIQKLDPRGQVLARRGLARSNTRDAAHLAITGDGHIAITDPGARRVGLLDANLSWVATVEGDGLDWPRPVGIAASPGGELWVIDTQRSIAVLVNPAPR